MKEDDQGPQELDAMGVNVGEAHTGHFVSKIPSDDESTTIMTVMRGFDDIFLFMTTATTPEEPFFNGGMRFRSYSGGGAMPHVSSELHLVVSSFMDSKGKEVPDKTAEVYRFDVTIPNYIDVEIKRGETDQEPLLVVKNIPGDDQEEDEKIFIDIKVERNEDVTVAMRNPAFGRLGEKYQAQGSISFKTKENGGKFPVMNAIFRSIAERIADGDISTSSSSDRLHA